MQSSKKQNKMQNKSNGESKITKENPIIIEPDDDCIELDKTNFKVSVLKYKLSQQQRQYAEKKLVFGFKFEFDKAICCYCRKEGHINCNNINQLIDNIYLQ